MLPQTTLEQRQDMYEELLELLNVGFLSAPVRVCDMNLSLRTLSKGDLFLLHHRAAHSNSEDVRRWMLAASTWMVNGLSLLEENSAVPHLYAQFQKMRPPHLSVLMHILNSLSKRQIACYDLMEAFLLEPISRTLWRQTNEAYPSISYSGIPGTDRIGTNAAQRVWISHNRIEDLRERIEAEWAHAKFVASATSPKGVEQLNQKELVSREAERTRKQETLDRAYYKWIGYLKEDGTVMGAKLPVFRQASTPDELAEEMRKWVMGEMDQHDRAVEDYKRRVLDAYERDMEARRQNVEAVRQQMEENGEDTSAFKLVGYTLEQLRDRAAPALHKTVYEAPKGAKYLYDKYLVSAPDKGKLDVQEGRVVVAEEPSLDEQISRRKVLYDSEG